MIGTEDEAIGTGEAEMIAGMARRVDRCHSGDRIAIAQQNIGREGGIGAEMEGIGGRTCACLEGSGRAEMVRMGMAEKDGGDLPLGRGHDVLEVTVIVRSGIKHDKAVAASR